MEGVNEGELGCVWVGVMGKGNGWGEGWVEGWVEGVERVKEG